MSLVIRVDAREVTEALDDLSSRDTSRALQKAVDAAGRMLATKGRAEAPPRPRKLKRSVRARRARRDRPGSFVSAKHPLNAIVQGGTKDRYTRAGAFRGKIKPNPFMERVADRYDTEALRIAEAELDAVLKLD